MSQRSVTIVATSDGSDLALVEKHLQTLIQETGNFLKKAFKISNDHRIKLNEIEIQYRQHMRILRRWRNGTDLPGQNGAKQLSSDLDQLRNDSIQIRTMVVADTLDEIDSILHKLGSDSSRNIVSQRQNIGYEMVMLREKTKHVEHKEYKKYESDFMSLEEAVINLKKCILEESKTKSKRKFSVRRHSSQASITSAGIIPRIEDHPEVNRVLKNAARIRRMMEAFREGYHVTVPEASACACVENDLEVLRRQLQKVRQWQQSILGFTKEEVDDLELILSAIESHIVPEIKLDSPLRKSLSASSVTSSRSNSRLSEISSDVSYSQPPPVTTEAPPTYEEACLKDTDKNHSNKDLNDNNAGGVEIYDERLI